MPREASGVPALGKSRIPRGEGLRRRVALLRWVGRVFHATTAGVAVGLVALVAAIVVVLAEGAWPSINHFGFSFLTGSDWDPVRNIYGAYPAIVGTLLTSAIALLIAVPIALGVSIFLSEVAPPWLRQPLANVVDLSAAVPSVVYGFWAFLALVPVMATSVEPGLARLTGGSLLFSGRILGLDFLSAGVVLAVMIIPTISAISRESLAAVPRIQRESALSLGATRWEATRIAVLGPARSGIIGGVMLGLGRAVGEALAVAMVIGNLYVLPNSLFSSGSTLATQIIADLSSAFPTERASLVELGLVLLLISLAVNVGARLLLWRVTRPSGDDRGASDEPAAAVRRRSSTHSRLGSKYGPRNSMDPPKNPAPRSNPWRERVWAAAPRRLLRRRAVHWVMVVLTVVCVGFSIVPLVSVVQTAVQNGGDALLHPSFYTSELPPPCNPSPGAPCPLGGIGPAIQGTLILLALASLLSLPIGLVAGIYLTEFGRGRFARAVSFLVEVMTGLPSIMLGVFVFALFLQFDHNAAISATAGTVALATLMVPIITRATEEGLKQVPNSLRESALAIGFPPHRVTLRVVLGCARSALVTGILLALARAAGETAAILFVAGFSSSWFTGPNDPIATMPVLIFTFFFQSYANWQEDAWGAALVLLIIMLVINVGARFVLQPRMMAAESG